MEFYEFDDFIQNPDLVNNKRRLCVDNRGRRNSQITI